MTNPPTNIERLLKAEQDIADLRKLVLTWCDLCKKQQRSLDVLQPLAEMAIKWMIGDREAELELDKRINGTDG